MHTGRISDHSVLSRFSRRTCRYRGTRPPLNSMVNTTKKVSRFRPGRSFRERTNAPRMVRNMLISVPTMVINRVLP